VLPLHHSEDQLTAGIRTQSLFFTERLFKFAEKNLTVNITGYAFYWLLLYQLSYLSFRLGVDSNH